MFSTIFSTFSVLDFRVDHVHLNWVVTSSILIGCYSTVQPSNWLEDWLRINNTGRGRHFCLQKFLTGLAGLVYLCVLCLKTFLVGVLVLKVILLPGQKTQLVTIYSMIGASFVNFSVYVVVLYMCTYISSFIEQYNYSSIAVTPLRGLSFRHHHKH